MTAQSPRPGRGHAILQRLSESLCQQQLIVAAVCKRGQYLLLGLQGIFLHCGMDFPLCRPLFCMIVLYYLLFSFTIEISILMMEMIELTVKDAVLQALEQARGTRLSGGRLAEQLGVSRAAVHKAIAALRESGLAIDAVTREGYRLMQEDGGVIAEGRKADFITINTMQSHLYPTGNLVNTLLECVTASDVCDMAVDGRLLMKDREVLTLDEEKILYEAMKYMEELEA